MIICNSSPIILLTKQGMLGIMRKCFGKVIIPKSVYDEVAQKEESPEIIALDKAIRGRWIAVEKVTVASALETKKLGQGEKEAISLAAKRKYMLIIDDDSAKTYASIFGVESHGVLYVIYLAYKKKIIDHDDAMNAMQGMIADGFYVSHDVYIHLFELLKSEER